MPQIQGDRILWFQYLGFGVLRVGTVTHPPMSVPPNGGIFARWSINGDWVETEASPGFSYLKFRLSWWQDFQNTPHMKNLICQHPDWTCDEYEAWIDKNREQHLENQRARNESQNNPPSPEG